MLPERVNCRNCRSILRNRLIFRSPGRAIHIYTVLDRISHWILHELDWKRIWQSSVSRTPRYTARGNAIFSLLLNWPHVCIVSRSSGCRSRLFFPLSNAHFNAPPFLEKKEEEKEEGKGKIPIVRSSSRLIDFHSIAIDSNF